MLKNMTRLLKETPFKDRVFEQESKQQLTEDQYKAYEAIKAKIEVNMKHFYFMV